MMTRRRLQISLALWQRRVKYRRKRHAAWVKRERSAKDAKSKAHAHAQRKKWTRLTEEAKDMVDRRHRQLKARNASDRRWGGSRAVTNEIIDIVGSRARITSRKRAMLLGNRGSDHNFFNRNADAVDFAIAEAHDLKNEVSRKLGGPNTVQDFGKFFIRRNGHTYRVQLIAGTHGTGPHFHAGVAKVS